LYAVSLALRILRSAALLSTLLAALTRLRGTLLLLAALLTRIRLALLALFVVLTHDYTPSLGDETGE
jgi:hypothetical protein